MGSTLAFMVLGKLSHEVQLLQPSDIGVLVLYEYSSPRAGTINHKRQGYIWLINLKWLFHNFLPDLVLMNCYLSRLCLCLSVASRIPRICVTAFFVLHFTEVGIRVLVGKHDSVVAVILRLLDGRRKIRISRCWGLGGWSDCRGDGYDSRC